MKKLIIACNIVIFFIVLIKIASVIGIIKNSETANSLLTVNEAAADSPVTTGFESHPPSVPRTRESIPLVRDVCEDSLSEERKLLASLLGKQKAIRDRENFLQSEKRRLNLLRDEILSKFDSLQELEKKLTALFEMVKERDNRKYKSMAKVYESVPPARAGFVLEKLDIKTAAAIIMNMKSKKAGAVLGHVNPAKSAEITREITKSEGKKVRRLED
jgi:flagellar motility protein MotE (MotC chaperone)